jgi:hypothetical protein
MEHRTKPPAHSTLNLTAIGRPADRPGMDVRPSPAGGLFHATGSMTMGMLVMDGGNLIPLKESENLSLPTYSVCALASLRSHNGQPSQRVAVIPYEPVHECGRSRGGSRVLPGRRSDIDPNIAGTNAGTFVRLFRRSFRRTRCDQACGVMSEHGLLEWHVECG